MIQETTIIFTTDELASISILATRFLHAERYGARKNGPYMTEQTRQSWLTACRNIVRKADSALDYCKTAGELLRTY